MNLTEQKLYKQIKDFLPGISARVENCVDTGFPDVCCTCGIDYWVELKVCDNKEKERHPYYLLRDSQRIWFKERGVCGSLIFVMVRYQDLIRLYCWNSVKFEDTFKYYSFEQSAILALELLITIPKNKNRFDLDFLRTIINAKIEERKRQLWSM